MTYIFNDIENFTDENYFQMISSVPEERAEKSMRCKFMIDKKISLIAFLLLIYGIKKEYGVDDISDFSTKEWGKPYLKSKKFSFNLSHSRSGVMCSIYNNEVGCDIEPIALEVLDARWIFSQNEIDMIGNNKNYFTKLWTLKETYSKCMCFGLTKDLNHIDFSKYIHKEKFEIMGKRFLSKYKDNFYYSVCVDSVQEDIQKECFLKSEDIIKMKKRI